MTEDVDDGSSSSVSIRLPATARYLRVARLTASSLAADLDFDMDQLDEVKVAVDELGAALLGPAGEGELELVFDTTDNELSVRGRRRARNDLTLDPIAVELLEIVTDAYDLRTDDGHHSFWLRKSRPADRDDR